MTIRHSLAFALGMWLPLTAAAQVPTRLPTGPAGTVTLPVVEYDRLVDRASQPRPAPEPPPVPAVVARADLRARITPEMARGTLRLDGEVFNRGRVKVPLVAGATLLEARADGTALPLLQEGDAHAAVLAGPAPFTLTLEWAAPISSAPGRASFVLPSPAAGSVSASLDLPGDPADVRVEPGIVTGRRTANGRTTIDVTLEPGKRSQVTWSVRETATQGSQAEIRTLADVKTLVTIGEADLRMVALVDITVVRGDPRTFEIRTPPAYEVAAITGTSIDTTETRPGAILLTVRDPAVRRHQFLVSLEQPHAPGSFKIDTAFPTVPAAQREIGETAVEGTGTIDVTASGDEGLRRMDVRETHALIRSLARYPLLAAFRYQRRAAEVRTLALDVKRFTDAPVIAAVAERASATTLVTVEGRTLTEVTLTIRNRAQPFMKVTLPQNATMVSVEVAGEAAQPVTGPDGTRVPLMRAGFRPNGPYTVSFVYLHAGQPFARRGDARMALPQFDVPVTVLQWELFLPERFSAKPLGGNVIPHHLAPVAASTTSIEGYGQGAGQGRGGGADRAGSGLAPFPGEVKAGQIVGRITDHTGTAIPGATVTVTAGNHTRQAVSDASGFYMLNEVPSGAVTITSEFQGFSPGQRSLTYDQQPRQVDFQMAVGGVAETVTVQADALTLNRATTSINARMPGEPPAAQPHATPPSQNVLNLQRRVAGVLPVRVDVPRAGTSYQFVRPLVLDEETNVMFRYKTR